MQFSKQEVEWAVKEVTRQRDTPMHVVYMLDALEFAKLNTGLIISTSTGILELGRIVNNDHCMEFRKIPVVFANGNSDTVLTLLESTVYCRYIHDRQATRCIRETAIRVIAQLDAIGVGEANDTY